MSRKRRDWILVVILFSYFMILLDNSIIFTGTVKIAADLGLDQRLLSWVSSAYSLTFGGFLLVGGRLGDIFGRRRVFTIGLVIFGLGSLLVGLSWSAPVIIASRAFQGVGSAILAPTTLAILMDTYTGRARTRAIAAYGAMAGIGASVSLVLGGVFASLLTWRVGFFINVPIAAWMYYLSRRHLSPAKERSSGRGLDWWGTVTSLLGMVSLVYAIVGDGGNLWFLLAAGILLGIFIVLEARQAHPMMPLRLFADRERIGAYAGRFLYMGAMLGFWFITPQIMQNQLGFTPLMAGVGFFPLTIVNFVVALQVSRLTERFGNGCLLVAGIFFTLLGMVWMSRFVPSLGYWWGIAAPMLVIGFGQGLALSPFTAAGVAHTLPEDAGAASGVVNVMHQIGGSVGLSALVAIQAATVAQRLSGTTSASSTLASAAEVAGFGNAILLGSALLLGSLLCGIFLVLPGEKRGRLFDVVENDSSQEKKEVIR
ncbi:MAG: MFS transporter [Bifidobacteriaceae bacterium]|jgi:MFS family permease|nr:MFS transporter [Bifidobacteriaceae bacterium]